VGRCKSKGVTDARVVRCVFSFAAAPVRAAFPGVAACRLWLSVLSSHLAEGDEHPHAERYPSRLDPHHQDVPGSGQRDQALIGIVLDGARVRAYVCDGTPNRLATLAEWFAGQVLSGRVEASSQDQAHLSAQLGQQSASGTLTEASGRVYAFTIPQVSTTARVGVFEGTALIGGQRYHAGWLMLPGGDQRGAASYFPASPIRGQIVIALLPEFPASPI
jgi:hypothetical protein